jgi:hypothetical protein
MCIVKNFLDPSLLKRQKEKKNSKTNLKSHKKQNSFPLTQLEKENNCTELYIGKSLFAFQ